MCGILCWVTAFICSLVTVYGQYCDQGMTQGALVKIGELSEMLKNTNSVPSARGQNIAQGKTAYQSSIIAGGQPGRAVDGKMLPNYNQRSCTHTARQQNPSWWVDLGKEYFVQSVVIQNRGDCCANRLRNVFISVGDDNKGGDMPACAHFRGAFQAGEVKEITCGTSMKGRYVKVHTGTNDYLTLCEVQVFGHPAE